MILSQMTQGVNRVVLCCLLAAGSLTPALTLADNVQTEPAVEDKDSPFKMLDRPQEAISQRIVSLSTKLDNFFGDERVFAESNKSFIRLYGDLIYTESHASDFSLKAQAKLALPALERRLKLVIESDDPSIINNTAEISTIETPKGVPNVDVPKGFLAALQVLLRESTHWHINTDAGIRIHSFLPDPFVRVRARYELGVGAWVHRFTQSVYWYEQRGAGESTQIDFDRKLTENWLARSRTLATWSDHDQRFYYEQGFSLFQKIDTDNAMSYLLGISGENQNNTHVTAYVLGAKWRHRLYREWLFGEVQPQIAWPEDQQFHATTSILFRLEAVFGDVGCNCYGL